MRERLAKDKGATYTYSMDYVSQTVSLVDESRLKEDQEVRLPFRVTLGVFYNPWRAAFACPRTSNPMDSEEDICHARSSSPYSKKTK